MVRFRTLKLVLALLLVMPAAASAQKDNQFTKEASKFVGLAMANGDRAARMNLYNQALTHLRQGQERDAGNAKVWLMSGTVLAALGQMQEADAAWKRAVELHPEYAQEISEEREAAWVDAFNLGMEAMDAQNYPEAIRILEGAETIFTGRPEALMNLGALYANAGENAKAADAFQRAIEATKGRMVEQLNDEQKAEWARFREMATLNIAQIHGATGVDAFSEQNYEEAARAFVKAAELNPYSRDYVFNHTQSVWAQISALEDQLEAADSASPAAAQIKTKLTALYTEVEGLARKTREFDPNNGNLYLIEARANRQRGLMAGTEAAATAASQAALRLLEQQQALPVLIDDVSVQAEADGATISGTVTGRAAEAGTPMKITFTLMGAAGQSLGQGTVTVNAPATDAAVPFEVKTDVTGEIAGWKYVVGN